MAEITVTREGVDPRTERIKLTQVMQYLNTLGVETVPDFESERLYVVSVKTTEGVITL